MFSHHAGRRFSRPLWGLPAILLSGVFLLITAAVPASAAPAAALTGPSVDAGTEDTSTEQDGATAVVAAHDRPDAVLGATYPGNDTDAPPPPSSYVDVAPLDRVVLQQRTTPPEQLLREQPGSASDPSRGPPADEQLSA